MRGQKRERKEVAVHLCMFMRACVRAHGYIVYVCMHVCIYRDDQDIFLKLKSQVSEQCIKN